MMQEWYSENVSSDWTAQRARIMGLLQDEAELDEMVKLVGIDALVAQERLKLEIARSIREDYLHQDAFHEVDTYASLNKQCTMSKLILKFYDMAKSALDDGININKIVDMPVRERIGRIKYVSEDKVIAEYELIIEQITSQIQKLKEEAAQDA